MKLALLACTAVLSCGMAASAPAAPVTPPLATASAPSHADFEPFVASAAVGAVQRAKAHELPACKVDRADAIVDGRIHVRPGETLCVRLRLEGDRVEAAGLVGGEGAADALVVEARLQDGHTFLTLTNPLPRWLRYRAWLRRPGSAGMAYTSSCPVMSEHRVGFEDWPYPIDELALGDLTLESVGADGQVRCR